MSLPAVVLYRPEIPPNTGNVIRLCANSGAPLHLIHPLGFETDDRQLRRAGLDYAEAARVEHHDSLEAYLRDCRPSRLFGFTTRGRVDHCSIEWGEGDAMLFGPETRGLPPAVLARIGPARQVRLPMRPGSRSINLSNSVAIAVYEAWRQAGFAGSGPGGAG